MSEEVTNSLDGLITISVYPILYRPSAKTHFPAQFQELPLILSLFPNGIYYRVTNGVKHTYSPQTIVLF
jgi:hypothetical protein